LPWRVLRHAGKPPEIPLVVVGCDFRIAAASQRGALVTTPEERARIHAGLARMEPDCGFAALETCNSIEWIVTTLHPEWMAQLLLAQLQQRWLDALPCATDFPRPYVHAGQDAVRHLFRVARARVLAFTRGVPRRTIPGRIAAVAGGDQFGILNGQGPTPVGWQGGLPYQLLRRPPPDPRHGYDYLKQAFGRADCGGPEWADWAQGGRYYGKSAGLQDDPHQSHD
jgi:hypothetical protein